jgi:hypothetical protein
MNTKSELKRDLLIYGKEYHLWRDGKYLGIATYADDPNIGEAFIKKIIEDGQQMNEVYIADEWTFA